jgi:hypothetical protein
VGLGRVMPLCGSVIPESARPGHRPHRAPRWNLKPGQRVFLAPRHRVPGLAVKSRPPQEKETHWGLACPGSLLSPSAPAFSLVTPCPSSFPGGLTMARA